MTETTHALQRRLNELRSRQLRLAGTNLLAGTQVPFRIEPGVIEIIRKGGLSGCGSAEFHKLNQEAEEIRHELSRRQFSLGDVKRAVN